MTKQFLFSASLLEKHLNQCIDRHTQPFLCCCWQWEKDGNNLNISVEKCLSTPAQLLRNIMQQVKRMGWLYMYTCGTYPETSRNAKVSCRNIYKIWHHLS